MNLHVSVFEFFYLEFYQYKQILFQQSNLDPLRSQIVGSTLLQSIEEIVIPCSFPTVYSTNQTIGDNI